VKAYDYGSFTLPMLLKSSGLTLKQKPLFDAEEAADVPPWLQEALDGGMALALGSEKARSEFIVVPVLLTSRKQNNDWFAIYSGQRLDVDPASGLVGECDFILTATPPLPVLQSPIITIVEARKNDVEMGLGQCAAQMLGARLFNQREGNDINTISGCVTTGETWQFLKLHDDTLFLDTHRYSINNVASILGVLHAIVASYR
jgi:hypothetical protein